MFRDALEILREPSDSLATICGKFVNAVAEVKLGKVSVPSEIHGLAVSVQPHLEALINDLKDAEEVTSGEHYLQCQILRCMVTNLILSAPQMERLSKLSEHSPDKDGDEVIMDSLTNQAHLIKLVKHFGWLAFPICLAKGLDKVTS